MLVAVRFPCCSADRDSGSLPTVVASRLPRPVRALITGSRRRSFGPFGQLAISCPAFLGLVTRSRKTPLTPYFTVASAFRLSTSARTAPPSVASTTSASSAQGAFHRRMRPSFGPLARPRARIRPPPRRGFAAAPRLPAPSFRLCFPLSRSAPADARFRCSGAGLPVPPRSDEPFGPPLLGRGVWRRSSTSAITSNPRAQPSNRPIPAGSIAGIDAAFARAGRTRALSKAETLVDLSLLVTGLLPSNQGPVAFAFARHQRDRCASGAFARSSPQLPNYPDFDVCRHLSSQSAWRVVE